MVGGTDADTLADLDAAAGDARRAIWDLAVDAAGIGTFDWDLRNGRLSWDERLLALFGIDAADFDGTYAGFEAHVHPEDLDRVNAVVQRAVERCTSWETEYRVLHPDATRWIRARGRALCDEQGTAVRVVGAAYDTTDAVEVEARTARVLESMSAAFCSFDTEWRTTYVNAEAERLLGMSRDQLLGQVIWELFPATVGSVFEREYLAAAESGQASSFEAYYPAPLNAWYEIRVWPSPDGLSVYFLDVTARHTASERAQLLARAAAELTETLDLEEAVARLAHLLVPAVADFCIVTLVDDEQATDWRRGVRDVGWAHADPALQSTLDAYARARVPQSTERSLLLRALRSPEPVVMSDALPRVLETLPSGELQDHLTALSPRSAVVQQMRARGRTLGLLTLCWSDVADPRQEDLATLAELAGRAGLALDNTRLYEQQRRLAEGLQRSLLTEPPAPNHLEVVVRYEPAAQAAAVGGDWYDAFLQRDGSTVLVIGDVVGHDTDAAAAMGQLRGLLRGIAATTGEGPADVLGRLDEAVELLQVGTTATAVVARFEQTPEERQQGLTRLRWSNAGHPPPLLLDAEGTVTVLDGEGAEADLLLGIDPTAERREQVVTVRRPSTVLLFTDGLVEQRDQTLDDGLARLQAILADVAHLPLEELCDEVLTRMLPERSPDDVALAAVRLHPLDRPRPPEAGPTRIPASVPDPPS